MAAVLYFKDYRSDTHADRPREICFSGALYRNRDGQHASINIAVKLKNGDVEGFMDEVIKMGGIGATDKAGTERFIPWHAVAAIEMRDLTDEECACMIWETKLTIEKAQEN